MFVQEEQIQIEISVQEKQILIEKHQYRMIETSVQDEQI
jgi:hypothetical protein